VLNVLPLAGVKKEIDAQLVALPGITLQPTETDTGGTAVNL
jgi:hypothetical protein